MVAANPEGEEETGPLRLDFDRSVKLTFVARRETVQNFVPWRIEEVPKI